MQDNAQILEFAGMPAVIRSEAMTRVFEMVRKIALTSAPVLICGESGTGKELIARAVHQYSLRSARPWIDINCASLPEHLVESELFGYEKGAFSGAEAAKPGLFELANTGTMFLDEIGELEAKMQVKLLRVLDGAPYYRLGGVRKVSVDVRIVAATNRNLTADIEGGRFRADLYHRLSQFQIHLPPLRERPEDAEAIALFFLRECNPDMRFSSDALLFLRQYSWPGNVREVRKLVTNAAIAAEGPEICVADLKPPNFHSPEREWNLDTIQRRMILEALAVTEGHQQKAADLLGISQRTLSRKLKRMGNTGTVTSIPELVPALAAVGAGSAQDRPREATRAGGSQGRSAAPAGAFQGRSSK